MSRTASSFAHIPTHPHGDSSLLTLTRDPGRRPATARTAVPVSAPFDGAEPAFAALGLRRPAIDALARGGIVTPSPIQALCIPPALQGRDVCGKARTGSGKTLAFGLPLLQRLPRGKPGAPTGLILVPTRELASQVAAALAPVAKAFRLSTFAIYGGVGIVRQAQTLRRGVDVVVGTPGRLNDLILRGDLDVAGVKVAVIDEADHMADLGFLPQVERILDGVGSPRQVLLFSATLDSDVDRLVRKYQDDPVFYEAETPESEAPAMQHRFVGVESAEKVAVAASIAAGPERTLFFVRTQRAADRLVVQLEREGVRASRIHGRLSQPNRERALRDFSSGDTPVLVATNIAARGIHVDGVDIVVHYDPPEDVKTYLHRSGRTARAGAAGVVVTLVEPEQARDVDLLRREADLHEAVVPMGPTDPRLADLEGWTPPLEAPVIQRKPTSPPQNRSPRAAAPGQPRGARNRPGRAPRARG